MRWSHAVVFWLFCHVTAVGCVTEDPIEEATAALGHSAMKEQSWSGFFAIESGPHVAVYDFNLKVVDGRPSVHAHMVPLSQQQMTCGKKTRMATASLIDHSLDVPSGARNFRKLESSAAQDIASFPRFGNLRLRQDAPGVFAADDLTFDLRDPAKPHVTFKGQKVSYVWRQNDGALALSEIVCPMKGFETVKKPQDWRDLAQFGNWCGLGHGGEKLNEPKPIDGVDATCMVHDLCYAEKGMHDCGCDADFLKTIPRAKTEGQHSKVFRSAAVSTFAKKPCQCNEFRFENFCNLSGCFDRQMVMASVGTGGTCKQESKTAAALEKK